MKTIDSSNCCPCPCPPYPPCPPKPVGGVITIIDHKGIQGVAGKDGLTPWIGMNKHWFIGTHDTGISAQGIDGDTPYIGNNGNWCIGNVDTGVAAARKEWSNTLY